MSSIPSIVGRRGELIAELFLQELNPSYVAQSEPDFGYDFFVGFPNSDGGVNTYGVEVKATERPIRDSFRIRTSTFERLAHSNVPALLLLVDVKQNQLFYAWITPEGMKGRPSTNTIAVPVTQIDDAVKEELRRQLAD